MYDPQNELIRQQSRFICSHSNRKLVAYVKASSFETGELVVKPEILRKIEQQGEELVCYL